jgi:glyoxylase-like metal-dependent hydrolase (beta-lactamase superfamily II)
MIKIDHFTFGPFQENTYILSDETRECIIIDPGCYNEAERAELKAFIASHKLKPVRLLNTHCHIDHVFGNKFSADTWNLGLEIHEKDLPVLKSLLNVARLYQLNAEESPEPGRFIAEGDKITFGNSSLDVLFCPGHCPGHVVFVSHEQQFVIGGDVLFYGSIGRTDLPGGHYQTLIDSIKNKLFPLGDGYRVYSGHGPETNIGFERKNNPFLT